MADAHATTAQCDPPRCTFPLVGILEVLGHLLEGGPGTEGADEMIRHLCLRIHLRTGLRQADLLEAIQRLPTGEGLDGTAPPDPIDMGAYSSISPAEQLAAEYECNASRRDLSHVLIRLAELDNKGTTARLWRWLWRGWPLFRDVFSAGMASAKGGEGESDTKTAPRKSPGAANRGRRVAQRRCPPLVNARRDAWVARQRAKKEPPSWEEIYDEGVRLSETRGWNMPGSPKALEEAHRRYLKRQRTTSKA
jgi:hypothetical protein